MNSICKYLATVVVATMLAACGGSGNGSSAVISALAERWSSAASLQFPRVAHTATLLPNGKVLVVGGGDNQAKAYNLASAELYDPATNRWTSAGAINTTGIAHTATLLQNGKVLVVHGATAELYDPASNAWAPAAPLIVAHSGTATLLDNGKVLIAGGYWGNAFLASAEVYDPATDSWTPAGSLLTARNNHSATRLASGKVLVAGGVGLIGSIGSAELYDPASNAWTPAGTFVKSGGSNLALRLPNGKVMALTESAAESYDPSSNSWAALDATGFANALSTVTLLPDGKVLVAGGQGGSSNAYASVDKTSLYDPSTNIWTAVAGLPSPRQGHTATLLPNGRVVVVGGVYFYSRLISLLLNIFEIVWDALDRVDIFNPLNL